MEAILGNSASAINKQQPPKIFSKIILYLSIPILLVLIVYIYYSPLDSELINEKLDLSSPSEYKITFTPKHFRMNRNKYAIVLIDNNNKNFRKMISNNINNFEFKVFQDNNEIEIMKDINQNSLEHSEIKIGEFLANPWKKYNILFKSKASLENSSDINLFIKLDFYTWHDIALLRSLMFWLLAFPFILILSTIFVYRLIRRINFYISKKRLCVS